LDDPNFALARSRYPSVPAPAATALQKAFSSRSVCCTPFGHQLGLQNLWCVVSRSERGRAYRIPFGKLTARLRALSIVPIFDVASVRNVRKCSYIECRAERSRLRRIEGWAISRAWSDVDHRWCIHESNTKSRLSVASSSAGVLTSILPPIRRWQIFTKDEKK